MVQSILRFLEIKKGNCFKVSLIAVQLFNGKPVVINANQALFSVHLFYLHFAANL